MTDVFDENITTPEPELTLVGDGKRYKSVVELERGKLEADNTIAARERELKELREELARRKDIEELTRPNQDGTTPRAPNPPTETPKPLSDEDLAKRIREVTQRDQEEQKIARNVENVKQTMLDTFGDTDKANEAVRRKAEELGVSIQFLQGVAAQSPKAFYAQLGIDSKANNQSFAPRSDANTAALAHNPSGPKEGTYQFYEEIRRKDPNRYFTPAVQNQLMKDAAEARARGVPFGN